MTYFFNQKKPKCKKRFAIKIDDIPINIKPITHEILDILKDEMDMVKPNTVPNESSYQQQNISTIAEKPQQSMGEIFNTQIPLQKSFKMWYKISVTLIPELVEHLQDRRLYLNNSSVTIYLDFNELRSESYLYKCNTVLDDSKLQSDTLLLNMTSARKKSQANLSAVKVKDKVGVHGQVNDISEYKAGAPSIQFVLSSEKSSSWIHDKNFHLMFSTIEWAVTKLSACIKHKEVTQKMKYEYTIKPKFVFYNDYPKNDLKINIYENAKTLDAVLECLSSCLRLLNDNDIINGMKIFEIHSNDGTRSIMYPSGNLAILYIKNRDYHLLQIFDDTNNQLVAQFSNLFGGMIFWTENNNPRVIIDKGGCRVFDKRFEMTKNMKWPNNTNNKLSHSINVRMNTHVSFHCSGKDSIWIKFDTNEGKSRFIEVKIHSWLFSDCEISTEKKCISSNVSYTSQTAAELSKSATTKQSKKDDAQKKTEEKNLCELRLNELKDEIRCNFENWITFVKERVKFADNLVQRKASRSAAIFLCRDDHFQTESLNLVPVTVQRNVSAPPRNLNFEKPLSSKQVLQRRLLSGKLKSVMDSKDISPTYPVCPLKMRSELLNKMTIDVQIDAINYESCLCSKSQISEITDLELLNFLRVVNTNQLVIVGVITKRDGSSSDERLKEKFIEESLSSLLSDIYEDDLKKSTQNPCTTYHQKSYRLYFYDIGNSGRYLKSTQSLLLKRHNILPGMCLIFKESKLLFADYIFNGYKATKGDLFKQMNLSLKLCEQGFCIPSDFQLNFNRNSKQWIEETAYSKIKTYNNISSKIV